MAQKSPCGEVRDGNADPHRAFAGRAGDRHQPTHALRDLIEAGTLVIGAVLTEAGNGAIDDAWIDLAHALIVDAEFCLHVGAEILDDDVGLLHQPPEDLQAFRLFKVERHRPLVAVQVLEVRALARAAELLPAILQNRIDLDDVGAPIRQLPHAGRTGPDAGEVEHGETGEGLRGAREGHFLGTPTKSRRANQPCCYSAGIGERSAIDNALCLLAACSQDRSRLLLTDGLASLPELIDVTSRRRSAGSRCYIVADAVMSL